MIIDKHIDKSNWCEIKDILLQITEIESLNLNNMGLTEFPKMSHIIIRYNFLCANNNIASFKDCPIINGDFYCWGNQITSFKDCPKIGGSFDCSSNQITSFKDCPIINGDFYCWGNQITSFKDCPEINYLFDCSYNQLTTFKDCPQIKGGFNCSNNQITSFKHCPHIINGVFRCSNNQITSFKDCPIVNGDFCSDFGIFSKVQQYSKEKKISLLEAQVELYNEQYEDILEHIDEFPDLVAYHRMNELNKLLCT